jgi:hypothetical protein
MRTEVTLVIAAVMLTAATSTAQQAVTLVDLDDYGNFHTAGVVVTISGDDLYTTDTLRFVKWEGTNHADLAALQSAEGQEIYGLSAPPLFIDPAGGDFTPGAESELINRGTVIPGINDGFEGSAPDMGAVESSPSIFSDGFESGGLAAWLRYVTRKNRDYNGPAFGL